MSVVSCTLSRGNRGGRFYVDNDGGISGEITVMWNVVTDSDTDGFVTVFNESKTTGPDMLPAFYTKYAIGGETEDNMYFLSVTPTQNESKLTEWQLSGTYRNLPLGITEGDAQEDPLTRPWKYRIDSETISKTITEGVNLDDIYPLGGSKRVAGSLGPLLNSAGQEFEETVVEPRTRSVLVAWKNFRLLEEIFFIQYAFQDSLNSEPFLNFPADHCEFLSATASELIRESDIEYHQGTVRIALNDAPQIFTAVNKGWKHWELASDESTKLINAVDDDGQQVSEPVLLDRRGRKRIPIELPGGTDIMDTIRYRTRTKTRNFNQIFG